MLTIMPKAFHGWLRKCALVALALSFLSGVWPPSVTHLSEIYLDAPASREKPAAIVDDLFNRAPALQLITPAGAKWLPDRPGGKPELILTTPVVRLDASRGRIIVQVNEAAWRYAPPPAAAPYKTGPPAA